MGVPPGSAVDAFVDDVLAHDGPGELRGVDADEEDPVGFPPGFELFGEEAGVAEFNREFLRAGVFNEAFEGGDIGEGGRELEQVVMDHVFEWCKEFFEPQEPVDGCAAEFLEVGDGAVDFDDPGEVFSLRCPGFDHVRVGEPVEAHVQLDGVEP